MVRVRRFLSLQASLQFAFGESLSSGSALSSVVFTTPTYNLVAPTSSSNCVCENESVADDLANLLGKTVDEAFSVFSAGLTPWNIVNDVQTIQHLFSDLKSQAGSIDCISYSTQAKLLSLLDQVLDIDHQLLEGLYSFGIVELIDDLLPALHLINEGISSIIVSVSGGLSLHPCCVLYAEVNSSEDFINKLNTIVDAINVLAPILHLPHVSGFGLTVSLTDCTSSTSSTGSTGTSSSEVSTTSSSSSISSSSSTRSVSSAAQSSSSISLPSSVPTTTIYPSISSSYSIPLPSSTSSCACDNSDVSELVLSSVHKAEDAVVEVLRAGISVFNLPGKINALQSVFEDLKDLASDIDCISYDLQSKLFSVLDSALQNVHELLEGVLSLGVVELIDQIAPGLALINEGLSTVTVKFTGGLSLHPCCVLWEEVETTQKFVDDLNNLIHKLNSISIIKLPDVYPFDLSISLKDCPTSSSTSESPATTSILLTTSSRLSTAPQSSTSIGSSGSSKAPSSSTSTRSSGLSTVRHSSTSTGSSGLSTGPHSSTFTGSSGSSKAPSSSISTRSSGLSTAPHSSSQGAQLTTSSRSPIVSGKSSPVPPSSIKHPASSLLTTTGLNVWNSTVSFSGTASTSVTDVGAPTDSGSSGTSSISGVSDVSTSGATGTPNSDGSGATGSGSGTVAATGASTGGSTTGTPAGSEAGTGTSATEGGASGAGVTTTAGLTYFTTYCPSPTTFTYGSSTYTVSGPTTLTITECPACSGGAPTGISTDNAGAEGTESGAAGITITSELTYFTTYCPSPTTFTHDSSTYTITEPTTLTLTGEPSSSRYTYTPQSGGEISEVSKSAGTGATSPSPTAETYSGIGSPSATPAPQKSSGNVSPLAELSSSPEASVAVANAATNVKSLSGAFGIALAAILIL